MTKPDDTNRRAMGRIAAIRMHALGKGNTAPGRASFLARFEREVDPEGKLSPAERQRRAAMLRRAHMLELAHRSAMARRTRKGA